jgi:uncharacterized protein YbjT (DUF2867 family)
MTIVVIGGTGVLGSKVVGTLRDRGHDTVAVSRSTGVNALTGEGLADALTGADVSNAPSFDAGPVMEFFTTSTKNLVAAARGVGVGHSERLVRSLPSASLRSLRRWRSYAPLDCVSWHDWPRVAGSR